MFPLLLSAPLRHLLYSVKHKDSVSLLQNTGHCLEVCYSLVRHWAYDPVDIFELLKLDVSSSH